MPFLPPNQQLQSTEGFDLQKEDECKISNNNYAVLFQINFQFQKMWKIIIIQQICYLVLAYNAPPSERVWSYEWKDNNLAAELLDKN